MTLCVLCVVYTLDNDSKTFLFFSPTPSAPWLGRTQLMTPYCTATSLECHKPHYCQTTIDNSNQSWFRSQYIYIFIYYIWSENAACDISLYLYPLFLCLSVCMCVSLLSLSVNSYQCAPPTAGSIISMWQSRMAGQKIASGRWSSFNILCHESVTLASCIIIMIIITNVVLCLAIGHISTYLYNIHSTYIWKYAGPEMSHMAYLKSILLIFRECRSFQKCARVHTYQSKFLATFYRNFLLIWKC